MLLIFTGIGLCKETFIHDARIITSMIYQEKLFTHNLFYLQKKILLIIGEISLYKETQQNRDIVIIKKMVYNVCAQINKYSSEIDATLNP